MKKHFDWYMGDRAAPLPRVQLGLDKQRTDSDSDPEHDFKMPTPQPNGCSHIGMGTDPVGDQTPRETPGGGCKPEPGGFGCGAFALQ